MRDPAFGRALCALTGGSPSEGNEVRILVNGRRIFPPFIGAIRGARRSVNLLTYVYWSGEIAREVAGAVAERARAGVRCNVLLDAVGSFPMNRALIEQMERAGARVVRFRPPRAVQLGRLNRRNHRKILVADGRVGFTGGVGIAQEWTGDAHDPAHWRDTHLLLRGPVVGGLQDAFAESWYEATGEALGGDDFFPPPEGVAGGVSMQVIRSSARSGATPAALAFDLALAAARERVWLSSAYFVPSPEVAAALIAAARRGVDVQAIVPGPHADKRVVRAAARHSYAPLIEAGVQIFEYQPTMMHAKTMTVDGGWSLVGSINVDARSLEINEEVGVGINDEATAGALDELFQRDRDCSRPMPVERRGRATPLAAARERLAWTLRRQL